ncbi:MAG: hypothetical protein ACJ790_19975 [Myxococcaceae bacterium]
MKDGLVLNLLFDPEGGVMLRATVQAGAFAGMSGAWFDLETLRRFSAALAAYPLGDEARAGIRGGYWKGNQGSELAQLHVSLSAYATDSVGGLAMRVILASPMPPAEELHRVEVALNITYNALSLFVADLNQLLDGKIKEAMLDPSR